MEDFEKVPDYVWDILFAFLGQKPLNFGKHQVPEAIQVLLKDAVSYGVLETVPYKEGSEKCVNINLKKSVTRSVVSEQLKKSV